MEYMMYLAAGILVCVAFVHSYFGERYMLMRLFKRDNLPTLFGSDDFTIKTLRFAWHVTSIAWLGFAGIIVSLAQPELNKSVLLNIIAVTFGIHFLIALLGSKGKHLSWVVFLLISFLVYNSV
ncbi:hypothetical protein [Aliivibrio kagoshimensis]|uniref:hypothetical protein n=1 Tax=Aliivibrio kagoshimensis TaxID=2910230 RepID=UPI003D0C5C27